MINLEWFRTFSAIYECSSITEASKKVNMTQPGVSKHLSALESYIGNKLFNRTTRKLVPTEYGKFLYAQINNPLQQLEKVEYYSNRRAKKAKPAITIGCTSDFFKNELKHRIYAFDMYIVSYFAGEDELIEALEADKIQLLIGTKMYDSYEHEFSFLKSEELVLICSNDIDVPKDIQVDDLQLIKWLQKQVWFSYSNRQQEIKKFWNAKFNVNPKIVPRYILPSYSEIVSVLKRNTGFSVVPKSFCKEELRNNTIKMPLQNSENVTQKQFYSYKLKNSNLKEITLFMEKMKVIEV